ncbi:MAG: radical SAM protein [Victivallales bacterium]|jgi:wyosine [tRNA(Phe)-imidazoG37] synthetase (radical SAM superfamily)|nr:radical SAM protein [Victivallales bacterium]
MVKKYVFGPVPSRRLGLSLGVDLVCPKTCSLNCIYCEAKETTNLTTERKEYVPIKEVIAELDEVLREKPKIDFVTFSGAGEPTLNSKIGNVVDFLKNSYPEYKICLLTNAIGLGDPEVRRQIADIDLIVPSLDASNAQEFKQINRPASGIDFDRFVGDMTDFCRTTKSVVNLELFIVPGINDSDESIARFAKIIKEMQVDLVQLNTLDRPGAVDGILPSTAENTRRFIIAFEPFVRVEAIGHFRYRTPETTTESNLLCGTEKRILDLISRRPATILDLQTALCKPENELEHILKKLFNAGLLEMQKEERGVFYAAPHYKQSK